MTKNFFSYFLLAFFLYLFSESLHAADINESLINTTIDTRTLFEKLMSSRPSVGPGSSVTTPVAYGVGWGTLLFGVAGQNGTQYTHRPFGEYAVGFGVGDPNRYVSLTTIITMGGLDEVVRDGNVNFQLSRNINSMNAIAVGLENAAPWGADKRNKMNFYAVGSRCTTLHFTADAHINIITSLGMGNSRFVHNYETHQDETGIFRPFASIGVQILPQAAVILDYVGLTYNAGISIVPFLKYPLVASLTAVDFTGRGGSHVPVAGSLGYSYTFNFALESMMKKILKATLTLLSIASFSFTGNSFATDIENIIAGSINGAKITAVSLAPIPNNDAVELRVRTTTGERDFIVTKSNIPVALAALKNPQLTGKENAMIANKIIQHGPLITYMTPPAHIPGPVMLAANTHGGHVVNVAAGNAPQQPANAPAVVAATIASANQQASR